MYPRGISGGRKASLKKTLTLSVLISSTQAVPAILQRQFSPSDPFAVLDKQEWVNPSDMTWDDFKAVPGTDWANPALKGTIRKYVYQFHFPNSVASVHL